MVLNTNLRFITSNALCNYHYIETQEASVFFLNLNFEVISNHLSRIVLHHLFISLLKKWLAPISVFCTSVSVRVFVRLFNLNTFHLILIRSTLRCNTECTYKFFYLLGMFVINRKYLFSFSHFLKVHNTFAFSPPLSLIMTLNKINLFISFFWISQGLLQYTQTILFCIYLGLFYNEDILELILTLIHFSVSIVDKIYLITKFVKCLQHIVTGIRVYKLKNNFRCI